MGSYVKLQELMKKAECPECGKELDFGLFSGWNMKSLGEGMYRCSCGHEFFSPAMDREIALVEKYTERHSEDESMSDNPGFWIVVSGIAMLLFTVYCILLP